MSDISLKSNSCEIITITNQKGGVGKTTTAINLSAGLSLIHHQRVLLIDMDTQGNATTSAGILKNDLQYTIADVLIDDVPLLDAIVKAPAGFDVIGSNKELAGLDITMSTMDDAPLLFKNALDKAYAGLDYDYIIIDCAPSLSLVTVNAMVATDSIIIPMQCEYYALEGLADLTYTIGKLQNINPNLTVRGVVRTLYDARNTLAVDVSAELERYFGDKLYQTVIPRNIRLAEAPSFGQSIFDYQKSSKGALAYQKLAGEVMAQSTHA